MSCPTETELSLHADGELTINAAKELCAHLADCSTCRRRSERFGMIASGVRGAYPAAPLADFTSRVKISIEETAPRPSWAPGIGAVALAGAAAVTLFAVFQDRPHGELAARGSLVEGAAQRVGVEARVDGRRLTPGDSIAASSGFTFEVYNRTGRELELMIFAVDAAQEVHWFYPAYLDPSTNPRSRNIPAQPAVLALDEGVRPENPAPGALRLVSIFAERPLLVRAVEAVIAERGVDGLSIVFPDAIVRSEIHEVSP